MGARVAIDPRNPDSEVIARAADIMSRGGVVVFPTTGLYGLGADAMDSDAVDRVFQLKQRPEAMPVLVLIHTVDQAASLVREISPEAQRLMDRLWPGGLTIIFHASDALPRNLCAGTGKIGVRLAAHPAARALVEKLGRPMTGTSANISGQPGASAGSDLASEITDGVDLVLDAGQLAGGPGSTIVDATHSPAVILRQGAVPEHAVMAALEKGRASSFATSQKDSGFPPSRE